MLLAVPAVLRADVYTAPAADGYRGIWYEITGGSGSGNPWNQNKYGGGLATYPQQHAPLAVRRTDVDAGIDRTYFVYGGDGGGTTTPNMVGYFDHNTGLMARPRTVLTRGRLDAHENPALAIDDDGHLFVFSSGHGYDRKAIITKSARPWEIDQWDRVAELDGGDARETFSYGQPHHVPGQGFVLLHTHYQGGGNRTLYTNSSADGITWDHDWALGSPDARPKLAAIENGQYQASWRFGDTVATAFNMHPFDTGGRPGPALDYRTNLYYAETSDLGQTWRTADGTSLADLPLIDADNPALVADFRSQGLNVYLKDVQRDAAGNPLLLFLTSGGPQPGPQGGPHTLRTAHYDPLARDWTVRDVLTTDHNYDHGSLIIDPDGTWRLVGPFLDPAQPYATGGNIGVWTSGDEGETWDLTRRMTNDGAANHTYVRRVLGGGDGFETMWASGHAWEPGEVDLFFSTADGRVFRMPRGFEAGQEFAAPTLVPVADRPRFLHPATPQGPRVDRGPAGQAPVPEPAAAGAATAAGLLLRRRPR